MSGPRNTVAGDALSLCNGSPLTLYLLVVAFFSSTNLIDLDLHTFVRRVQSSPVKKNVPYHFGIVDLRRNSGPVPFSGFANQTQ